MKKATFLLVIALLLLVNTNSYAFLKDLENVLKGKVIEKASELIDKTINQTIPPKQSPPPSYPAQTQDPSYPTQPQQNSSPSTFQQSNSLNYEALGPFVDTKRITATDHFIIKSNDNNKTMVLQELDGPVGDNFVLSISYDGGNTWKPIFLVEEHNYSSHVAPPLMTNSDASIIVYKGKISWDYGKTWYDTKIGSHCFFAKNHPNFVYCRVNGNILYSTDYGRTFIPSQVSRDIVSFTNAYADINDPYKIYLSSARFREKSLFNSLVYYVVVYNLRTNEYYTSKFENMNEVKSVYGGFSHFSQDAKNPNNIFISYGGNLYLSNDGGMSFKKVNYTSYYNAIFIHNNKLFVFQLNFIDCSDNGGITFKRIFEYKEPGHFIGAVTVNKDEIYIINRYSYSAIYNQHVIFKSNDDSLQNLVRVNFPSSVARVTSNGKYVLIDNNRPIVSRIVDYYKCHKKYSLFSLIDNKSYSNDLSLCNSVFETGKNGNLVYSSAVKDIAEIHNIILTKGVCKIGNKTINKPCVFADTDYIYTVEKIPNSYIDYGENRYEFVFGKYDYNGNLITTKTIINNPKQYSLRSAEIYLNSGVIQAFNKISLDGGITWINTPMAHSSLSPNYFIDDDERILKVQYGLNVLMSKDRARDVTVISKIKRPAVLRKLNKNHYLIVDIFGEIYETTNGGDNWVRYSSFHSSNSDKIRYLWGKLITDVTKTDDGSFIIATDKFGLIKYNPVVIERF
ncbi:MAG: hypothetical protein QXS37_03795 [Candidatus Aenigmatarchaeota archaeon]